MLAEWFRANGWWLLIHHGAGTGLSGVGMWWLLNRLRPPKRNFVIDETTGEMKPTEKGATPFTLARCLLCSFLLLGVGYLAVWPAAAWPLPLGFPGFQFLFMLLGVAIWVIGVKWTVGGLLGMERGWWLIVVFYVAISAVTYWVVGRVLGLMGAGA